MSKIYKLVILSDIHHDVIRLQKLLPLINASDYTVFCGDGFNDLLALRPQITAQLVCVRGNTDHGVNIAEMASFTLGSTRALVTHGYKENAKQGISGIVNAAKFKNCSLAFFGHTHKFYDNIIDGVHLVNPGALQSGSYAVMLGDGEQFSCTQKTI